MNTIIHDMKYFLPLCNCMRAEMWQMKWTSNIEILKWAHICYLFCLEHRFVKDSNVFYTFILIYSSLKFIILVYRFNSTNIPISKYNISTSRIITSHYSKIYNHGSANVERKRKIKFIYEI